MNYKKMLLGLVFAAGISALSFANSFAEEVNIKSIDELSPDTLSQMLEANSEKSQALYDEPAQKTGAVSQTSNANIPDKVQKIIELAKSKLGSPYSYGSAGPHSFDCSGFTYYIMSQNGISLPHSAAGQAGCGVRVSKAELKPGDLVFFDTYGGISHAGLYIGSNKFIHASSYGSGVKISDLNEAYYAPRFVTGARVL